MKIWLRKQSVMAVGADAPGSPPMNETMKEISGENEVKARIRRIFLSGSHRPAGRVGYERRILRSFSKN